MKPATYSPHEQEVLNEPDHFIIRLFQQNQWTNSVPFTAEQAIIRFANIRKMSKNHRIVLYAVRGQRLVCVTPEYVAEHFVH